MASDAAGIESKAYLSVYQVLDDVCFGDRVPVGTRATIHFAVDDLKRVRAPAAHVGTAEAIALALHKLEWAVRNGDRAEHEAARDELRLLGASWLQTPMRLIRH